MNLKGSQFRVTDGVAQVDRLPVALSDGYFRPQERELHDHLAIAARLADASDFSTTTRNSAQNWLPLFQAEPAVALAELLSIQLDARRLDFEAALDSNPDKAVAMLYRRAKQIERLRDVLVKHKYQALVDIIDNVGDEMRTPELLELADRALGMKPGQVALELAKLTRDGLSDDLIEKARLARRLLGHAHEHFVTVINAVRPRAKKAFSERINSGGNSQAPPTFECYCQFYGESNLPFCACFFSFLSEFCGAGLISLNQWWDGSGCRP